MTDQTPNGEKKQTTPAPAKKKTSAYDQPFNVMKDADQIEVSPRTEPVQRTVEEVPQSDWRSTSTAEPQTSVPVREPEPRKTASSSGQKKKKSSGTATKKAKNEMPKQKGSAPAPKGKEKNTKMNMDLPRSARPGHKVLPYVFYGLALFIGISLLLNIFCNWQNCLQDDPSQHWMGVVGYHICYGLFGLFGPAVFTLPALLVVLGVFWKQYIDNKVATSKIIASVIFIVSLSAVVHIFCLMPLTLEQRKLIADALMRHGAEMTGGGVIGGSFGYLLYSLGNFTGSLIIGFFLLAVSLFYLLGMTPQHLWNRIRNRQRTRAGRAPSYSEQSAEDAEIRAKMDEKIRRTTTRQLTVDDSADFAAEAPLGAVRVVQPAAKKSPEDRMAPMPMPKLDPTEEDKLFVPDKISERMSAMEKEPAPGVYPSMNTAAAPRTEVTSAPTPTPVPETKPVPSPDAALNRDAAVEPIFPKTAENRQVRRVPREDRNFDLKNVFIDLNESDARLTKRHAPVPPEVPLSASAKTAQPTQRPAGATPVARPATPAGATTARPAGAAGATAARPVSPAVRPAQPAARPAGAAPTAAKPAAPKAAQKPAGANPAVAPSITAIKQPTRGIEQPKDFGLTSEEFERLESQQQSPLPRAGAAAKKPAQQAAATAKKPAASADAKPAAGAAKTAAAKPAPKPAKPKKYVFPPVSYLQPGEPMTAENRAELEQSSMALAQTLRSFHVNIEDAPRYSCGPTVTRYEVTPAAGVRVRTITNLADDIALALRSSGGVRIEAPIPGTNSVGIEIPNRTRSTIYLRELIESKTFTSSQSKLTACLGSGIAGEPLIFDIAKMPHLLIAGTTGSGKSVCINCIVMSLLYKATPKDVRLIMIDPKKVEFSIYKNIPHLMAPVVTTPKDAAGALQAAVEEMEHRFELFEQVGVRDLKGYNTATKDDPDMPHLPYVVIIIDELADLMMTARDEVETAICRIAQKARAAGMHLIIGTQRPSADVVTGLIKANIPSRIAFAVKSQVDSRVILDHIGAESLTGRGDMLFVPIGSMRDTRVQGAFVDDKEVERICEFIRATNGTAEYDEKFISKLKELAAQCGNKGRSGGDFVPSGGEDGDKSADTKYADAVRIAIEEKRISTSLLQRKLEIGYSRAAKLIDRMQAEGYVSPPDGSKPRTILITPEEYMEKFIDNPSGGEEA
ncbi:MAG: DNA translocase FtsK 4TM domain-containing protein [Clostridia bacterium]|nr:DNA translocase FtsK 4TM domain-containing protein [Clostridia bacterium]